MRKILVCFLSFLLVSSLFPAASGAEAGIYPTAGDLWEHWCEEGQIPDYITGIWSTDGTTENLTFGLLPGEEGELGREEILSWIADDSTVTFTTQTYSRNYLMRIMEDVNTYFDLGLGFISAGPSEYANVVCIELHRDYETNPNSLAAVAELEEKYGSAVSISFTDTVYVATVETVVHSPMMLISPLHPADPASPLPVLLGACALLLLGIVCTHRRRMVLLQGTAAMMESASLEDQIRHSEPKVPASLDVRMADTLDQLCE